MCISSLSVVCLDVTVRSHAVFTRLGFLALNDTSGD